MKRTVLPEQAFYEVEGILLTEEEAFHHLRYFLSKEKMERLKNEENVDFKEAAFKSLYSLYERTEQGKSSSRNLEERIDKCFERAYNKARNMKRNRINFVVAIDSLYCIGKDNTIPWKQKTDLKHFKELTHGNIVVMGYNTYKSIGKLPGRENRILSRTPHSSNDPEVIFYTDKYKAISKKRAETRELFIIGGQQIYELYFEKLTDLYLTTIDTAILGDTFFPDIPVSSFETREALYYKANSDNEYNMNISHLRIIGKHKLKVKPNKHLNEKRLLKKLNKKLKKE